MVLTVKGIKEIQGQINKIGLHCIIALIANLFCALPDSYIAVLTVQNLRCTTEIIPVK